MKDFPFSDNVNNIRMSHSLIHLRVKGLVVLLGGRVLVQHARGPVFYSQPTVK